VDPNDLPRPFGEFTLLRLIAQGGMGAVYLALRPVDREESQMRRLPEGQEEVCVVKTVRSDLKADREAIGRFLDEARVVQKLTHPRIARTLEAGIVDKTYFLALEFISGRNLRDVHTRAQKLGRALPDALIVHVLSEMLEALDYSHHLKDPETGSPLQIVHRDVSPHNVMLGFDGNTRLIDFGLAAHELKRELTRPGVMVGKLRYNAPEQVRDRALDGRSDVYSAAVVLYEFIANERFYEGLPEEQVWRVAMKGDHRPRSWRDIDIEWRHLLDVALQNDPEKRYSNAREFRAALLDVAESRGINLSTLRKDSRQFMKEAFDKEQIAEREMILQATGIAEARTQLFRSPSEVQSAIQKIPQTKRQPRDVEVKTEILDGNAAHLVELRNMMSRLADPDAVTQLPGDPIDDADSSEDDDVDDVSLDGDSLGAAASAAASFPLSGGRPQSVEDDDSDEDSALSDPRDRRYAKAGRNDDLVAPTVAARKNVNSGQSRGIQHDDDSDSDSVPVPPPVITNPSLSRRSRGSAPLPPLPPRPPPPKKKASSPLLALALGLIVVVVVGVLAIVLIPRLLKPDLPTIVDAPIADAGAAVAAVVDAGAAAVVAVDAGAAAVDAGAVVVIDAGVVDAGVVVVVTPDGDPRPDEVVPVVDVAPPKNPTTPTTTTSPPKVKKPTGPPKKVPASFGDQLTYLKQYCVGRVQCAQSIVGESKNIMKLTPDELRDLKTATPRCIDKCQRQ